MITKYRTKGTYFPEAKITKVEVERETEASVWIEGRRNAKKTEYYNYHDSFREAKAFLVDIAEKRLSAARYKLQKAQGFWGNVQGLKEDSQ